MVDNMTASSASEAILEPELPIIDAHHHLWFQPQEALEALSQATGLFAKSLAPAFTAQPRYLFDEFLADVNSGHNIVATVFVEVHTMYRRTGPEAMRSVGEVEFANGMAAIAASGVFSDVNMCAAIVGGVDLQLGDAVEEVLHAHIQAGGGRYRGIRAKNVVHDRHPEVLGVVGDVPHMMQDRAFRAGFAHLAPLGLSYDAWQLEYQLPDLVDLARAFPDTQIIVNHVGGLFGIGPYAGQPEARFAAWKKNIQALAGCPNVAMKLGGLGMPIAGLPTSSAIKPTSQALADDWRPYIESCIEAFGVSRCMFESNFAVDAATTSYPLLWNAFKRITAGASASEKAALYSGTATRIYNIAI